MIPRACSVALPLPVPKPYTYAIPTALVDRIVAGARVVVPVRARELVGVVTDVGPSDRADLKSVLLAPDPVPMVPQRLLELGAWVARYHAVPLGVALRAMLPAALWGRSKLVASIGSAAAAGGGTSADILRALERSGGRASAAQLRRVLQRPVWDGLQRLAKVGAVELETEPPDLGPRPRTERLLVLTAHLPTLLERERTFGRAARQRAAYEALDAHGGSASAQHLTQQLGFSSAVLRALVDRGVARFEERERPRDPFGDVAGEPPARPTDGQADAIAALTGLSEGGAATLFGVTGSGKTLVYLEALRRLLEGGGGAIVLVPEIALTPQTVARVRGVFGDTVAVLHSGLSDAERVDAWRGLVQGARRVAVGPRSAVFAPVPAVRAIVVDEEHDASYKNGEAPRYHARDVALRRAQVEGARVILGSATPSLETWAARARMPVVALPSRVTAQPLPPVTLVDMRSEARVREAGAVPWSETLDRAVEGAVREGDQVLLLLNRRGFAHFLLCHACGQVWTCPACSISLTVHRAPDRLRCHYCGHEEPQPTACGACGAATHRTRGVGTQSLERWLGERFPSARLARMDADTTSGKWSHRRILDAVARREVDVLFGTQMIAKGLDFPGVTLVGVIDGDSALHLPDFRGPERTFQLVAQVAGRAGRGPKGGRVLVQTHTPGHYALQAAASHDYQAFAEREMETRRVPAYPPHVGLVNVVVSGREEPDVAAAAVELADWLRGLIQARAEGAVEVVGPAPAPLARLKERWRWHLVLRTRDREWLGRVMRYAARRAPHAGPGPIRVIFDRDPVALL